MNFGFNEEQELLRSTARKFFENECPSEVVRTLMDSPEGITPALWVKLAEQGWTGLTYPEAYDGMGLGLSIARQLIELHGGSVSAQSPGLGQGSTFTALFPRSPVTAGPADSRVCSQAERGIRLDDGPDLTGIHVLVAEDNDDARGLIEKVLESQGATVRAVASAREALGILGVARVDVLVSDLEMPGMDGYQLIRELRLRPAFRGGSVPAAALTAYARTEDRLRALRAGFQLHLPKPVQPSELVTVVASLAGRRNV